MDSSAGTTPQVIDNGNRMGDRVSEPQLVALHEVVQAVARQTDLRTILSLIAEKARSFTGATSAAVTLLEASRTLLDFAAVAGVDAAEILGQTVRVEDALAGPTALTGELYLAHNPDESRPLLATLDPDLARGWGVRSAAVVPIFVAGKPIGALAAINREDNSAFAGGDILRLQVLANTAALALGADDLRRQAAQKQRERDILYESARATSSSLNVQEVLRGVLSTVAASLEMTTGAVYLLNDERTRLYIGADQGLGDEDRERQLTADTGLLANALATGQPLRVDDMLPDESPDDPPLPGMRSLLAAPMLARSTPEGIIVVGSRQAGAYSTEDAQLLSAVAGQAAVALENAWLYEDATRRAQEATAIYELSQAVGATLQLNRVLHFVADSVLALLHVDKFALFLYDDRAGHLEIKIARNLRREALQAMKPRMGEGIAGWVLEFETPTAVQDVAADHRNRSCPIDTEGVTSLVSVPLQSGDRVIGVLHAMSSRRRLFTVGEMELLYTIANQVGAAIANAQMYEEARQKSDEIRKGVRRVARALGSSLDGKETAQVIAALAAELMEADRSVLYALDAQGRLFPRAASNFKSAVTQGATGGPGETPAAWVARRSRSLMMADINQDGRFVLPAFAARERVCGYLGVPLKLSKDVLGVLEVYTRAPRHFTADEIRLLITFASQASVGLQNALLVEQANRRLADLQTINRLAEALCATATAVELLESALPLIGEATETDQGSAQLFGPWEEKRVHWHRSEETKHSAEEEAQVQELIADVREHHAVVQAPSSHFPAVNRNMMAVPIPGVPDSVAPLGALVLMRSAQLPAFDAYDRQLVTTAASLLAARLLESPR